MKCILCKPDAKPEVVELAKDHDYTDIKKLLDIESPLTCVERKIGKNTYDFWIDDEGLYKEKKQICGLLHTVDAHEILCGNILIALHDYEGNVVGLNDRQIEEIMEDGFICVNEEFLNFARQYTSKDGNNFLIIADYDGWGEIYMNKNGNMLRYDI